MEPGVHQAADDSTAPAGGSTELHLPPRYRVCADASLLDVDHHVHARVEEAGDVVVARLREGRPGRWRPPRCPRSPRGVVRLAAVLTLGEGVRRAGVVDDGQRLAGGHRDLGGAERAGAGDRDRSGLRPCSPPRSPPRFRWRPRSRPSTAAAADAELELPLAHALAAETRLASPAPRASRRRRGWVFGMRIPRFPCWAAGCGRHRPPRPGCAMNAQSLIRGTVSPPWRAGVARHRV